MRSEQAGGLPEARAPEAAGACSGESPGYDPL
jgi:hypothetical protein